MQKYSPYKWGRPGRPNVGEQEITMKIKQLLVVGGAIILFAIALYSPGLAGEIRALDLARGFSANEGNTFFNTHPCDLSLGYPQPNTLQPGNGELVKVLQPNFKWDNPFDCVVPGWELQVWRDDPFAQPVEEVLNMVLNPETLKYQMTTPLDKNTRYRWLIGPSDYFVGNVNQNHFGEAYFWTGPFCEFYQLLAPQVAGPENGSVYSYGSVFPTLDAKHPGGCSATEFEYQASLDPSFGGTLYQWGSFHINTSLPNVSAFPGSISTATSNLNCKTMFWRLRVVHESGDGPWSDTFNFYINVNKDCATIYDFAPDLPLLIKFPDWPWVWPIQPLNCRVADEITSRNIGTAFPDQLYQVLALNPESTHLRISIPEISVRCFVPMSQVSMGFGRWPLNPLDLGKLVPKFNPDNVIVPPTPTPEPEREAPPEEEEEATPTFIVVEEGHVCVWTGVSASIPDICAVNCRTGYADSGQTCVLP
jgi:hypothetical protein